MPSRFDILVDGEPFSVDIDGSPAFSVGKAERLSRRDTDITFDQDWYQDGYKVFPFQDAAEFSTLHRGVEEAVKNILVSEGISADGFQLCKYHEFVTTDRDHLKIVGRTRDLFPQDFNFSVSDLTKKLALVLGFDLTDINPDTGKKIHIIVRINRPGSEDYNPPHKDIYEVWDRTGAIPLMVNFWIPICGVTERSSLPLAAGSHLLAEDEIVRTVEGGVVNGRRYRVRNIKSWGGKNEMTRVKVNQGEILVFSSHLIHGLAINGQQDQTRVALEFRLLKRQHHSTQ
jgi:hypothetical protein